jgi:hypothetical protein
MPEKILEGKITFIHHEKNRAVLEYLEKDKLKTIQVGLDDKKKPITTTAVRPHRYLIGDTFSQQRLRYGTLRTSLLFLNFSDSGCFLILFLMVYSMAI